MSGKISQDLTVPFKASLFIPGVDLTLPAGQRNIKLQAGSIASLATTPQQYGAVGDGMTDSTAAFNAALAALATAGGGRLYIPAGNYVINGTLTYTAGELLVQGDGKDTFLKFGSTNANMFQFSGIDITLTDFKVWTQYQTSTAGVLFNFTNASAIKLNRISTDGGYNVVQFLGSAGNHTARTSITDCNFVNVMGNCVFYDQYCAGIAIIADTEMLGAPSDTGNGIIIFAGDTFMFSNINVAGFHFGINVPSTAGGINYVANMFCGNVLCDSNGFAGTQDGWYFDGTASGTYVRAIHLSGCWGGSMGRHGFNVNNATDVTFTNCVAIANQGNGFMASAPSSDITLEGCSATANSANNPSDNDGIHIAGAVTDFIITGCRLRPMIGAPNTQRNGIAIEPAASDRYIITNNNLHGNIGSGLNDGGTGATKFVSQNIT